LDRGIEIILHLLTRQGCLPKVLKTRLIATFAGVVGTGILIVGDLFNLLR
jgi:hypothetical protein